MTENATKMKGKKTFRNQKMREIINIYIYETINNGRNK